MLGRASLSSLVEVEMGREEEEEEPEELDEEEDDIVRVRWVALVGGREMGGAWGFFAEDVLWTLQLSGLR